MALDCSTPLHIDPSFSVTICIVSASSIISFKKTKLWLLVYHTLFLLIDKSLQFVWDNEKHKHNNKLHSSVALCNSEYSSVIVFTKVYWMLIVEILLDAITILFFSMFDVIYFIWQLVLSYFFPKLKLQNLEQGHYIQWQNYAFSNTFSKVLRTGSTVVSGKFIFKCSYPEGTY